MTAEPEGWTNTLRALHPDDCIRTFWKYLRNAFARDAGLRIDHILLGPAAARHLQSAGVDREVRDRDRASDHTPAWVGLKAGEGPRESRLCPLFSGATMPSPYLAVEAATELSGMTQSQTRYRLRSALLRGDVDRTVEWLDRTWANHDISIHQVLYDPVIMSIPRACVRRFTSRWPYRLPFLPRRKPCPTSMVS